MSNGTTITAVGGEALSTYWIKQSPFLTLAVFVLWFVGFKMVEPTQQKNFDTIDKLTKAVEIDADSNAKNAVANAMNASTNALNAATNAKNAETLAKQTSILERWELTQIKP